MISCDTDGGLIVDLNLIKKKNNVRVDLLSLETDDHRARKGKNEK